MKSYLSYLRTSVSQVKRSHLAVFCASLLLVIGLSYWFFFRSVPETDGGTHAGPIIVRVGPDEVQLTEAQASELKAGPSELKNFDFKRSAIGIIDFNQDMAVQVFSPYQGRISSLSVRAGEEVARGKILYTVQIPDIATAASTLISTSGSLKNLAQTLRRAQALYESQSISLKELQQNTSDHQAALAAYTAARKTLSLFGLSDKDVAEIETKQKIDTEMPVRSPFAGRVTARAGAIGQLVQPGTGTAPIAVANLRTLWMVANIPESEVAGYKVGQSVAVKVQAYPTTSFLGRISYISDTADAAAHRITVRAEISNEKGLLKPQMLATFDITLGKPVSSVAVPSNALARESDGSIYVWTTEEGLRFKRKKVETGLIQDGMVQVTSGLSGGEQIARDKALFISNLYLISAK